jgi:anti-sigma B factor antagonist
VESRPSSLSADIVVVLPQGRLDAQQAPALERSLSTLEERGQTQIVLNLARASYVSSSSLRVILLHMRRLRQAGGDLKLCCLTDKIAEVIRITGLDSLLDILLDEADAVRAFSAPTAAAAAPSPPGTEPPATE